MDGGRQGRPRDCAAQGGAGVPTALPMQVCYPDAVGPAPRGHCSDDSVEGRLHKSSRDGGNCPTMSEKEADAPTIANHSRKMRAEAARPASKLGE